MARLIPHENSLKNLRGGSRKGRPNRISDEIRELATKLFEPPYWARMRRRVLSGKLPPVIEVRLLSYAYGEPKQTHRIEGGLGIPRVVIHELRGIAPGAEDAAATEIRALPAAEDEGDSDGGG